MRNRVPIFKFDTMYKQMAEAAGISETKVCCRTYGKEQTVNGARCIAHGLPECHDETMRLVKGQSMREPGGGA